MVSTKGNRYRMFLVICMGLMSQWSGNGLISYCKLGSPGTGQDANV